MTDVQELISMDKDKMPSRLKRQDWPEKHWAVVNQKEKILQFYCLHNYSFLSSDHQKTRANSQKSERSLGLCESFSGACLRRQLTLVEKMGASLSVRQRQLVGIVRALVREATAS